MSAALVVFLIVVALVAIDAIGRFDERRARHVLREDVPATKITIDLTHREP